MLKIKVSRNPEDMHRKMRNSFSQLILRTFFTTKSARRFFECVCCHETTAWQVLPSMQGTLPEFKDKQSGQKAKKRRRKVGEFSWPGLVAKSWDEFAGPASHDNSSNRSLIFTNYNQRTSSADHGTGAQYQSAGTSQADAQLSTTRNPHARHAVVKFDFGKGGCVSSASRDNGEGPLSAQRAKTNKPLLSALYNNEISLPYFLLFPSRIFIEKSGILIENWRRKWSEIFLVFFFSLLCPHFSSLHLSDHFSSLHRSDHFSSLHPSYYHVETFILW